MPLESIRIPAKPKLTPEITVIGVGGAGCNAVQNMKSKGLEGVRFVIANTDAQCLDASDVEIKIQLGPETTRGLGAGADPETGLQAAEESLEAIREQLEGVHMLFVTAGMGGGTGTGAAPVVARLAREMDILTVGVVTKPFLFEGGRRMDIAVEGIKKLRECVHTSVVIPNQNLFEISKESTTTTEAFMIADDVLYEGVKNITDLMVKPGRINLDFADVRTVMLEMGSALMGSGECEGKDRALNAAKKAIKNDLLEPTRLSDATGVLINIIGGDDLTLFDMNMASEKIQKEVNKNARIILGSTLDKEYDGKVKVTLLAAGVNKSGSKDESDEEQECIIVEQCESFSAVELDEFPEAETMDDEVFKPQTWPHEHVKGETNSTPSEIEFDDQEEFSPHEGGVEPTSAQWSPRNFVFPKPRVADVNAEKQYEGTEASHKSPDQASVSDQPERPESPIGSVIRRMTKGSDTYHQRDNQEPQTTLSKLRDRGEDLNRRDQIRKLPAYLRRQAN